MNNYRHKIISVSIAIAFVVFVQWFVSPVPIFRFLIPAFLVYVGLVMLYTWRYLRLHDKFQLWIWLRLPIFLGSWFWVLFLVPAGFARALFYTAAVVLIFFFINTVGNRGQQLAWNQYLVTLFAIVLSVFGFSFYFVSVWGLAFLVAMFVLIALATRTAIQLVPQGEAVKWVASLVMALFAVELFWVLQFLPLHYTVLAVIEFNILYLLWAIYYHYLYQTLNTKQIQFNLLLVIVLSIGILLTTPWSIQG